MYRPVLPWIQPKGSVATVDRAWDRWCKEWAYAVDLANRLNKHGRYRE